MSSSAVRERDNDDDLAERSLKRVKVDEALGVTDDTAMDTAENVSATITPAQKQTAAVLSGTKEDSVLPPSHALLGAPRHAGSKSGDGLRIMETDVGISEYVGHDIPKIEGIIKQRRATIYLLTQISLTSLIMADSLTSSYTRLTLTVM
jgi:tRNA pseudouridine13 synthase